MDIDNLATFIHRGEKHCPKCGMIGNSKEKEEIKFFKCPGCETEFTKEMILMANEEEVAWENN